MDDATPFQQLVNHARRQPPRVALILGSGLGELAERAHCLEQVSYADVPELDRPTVPGHQGTLMLGTWGGQTVLLFSGRLHYYEGPPWSRVVQPVRIAHDLGASILLLTNAAGGIRDDLVPGDLLAMNAHIDWTEGFRRQPPTSESLDPRLGTLLQEAGRVLGMTLPAGLYAQVTGPCYETPAEIRALKSLGVDAVGMSTAREARAGREWGLACAALSCITNRAAGLGLGPIHHGEVLARTALSKERIAELLERLLERLE